MCPDSAVLPSRDPTNDQELNAEQLRAKYDRLADSSEWGEHPIHSMEQWRADVDGRNTRLGYWDWVLTRLNLADDEGGESATIVDAEEEEIAELHAADPGNQGA